MKVYFVLFSPAVVANLVNICVLLLYSYMYLGQYGHAEEVTFNLDSDLCPVRSVVGSRNRSKKSMIRQDRNLANILSPHFLGLLPHPLSSCRPLLFFSSLLILSIPRLLDQWEITVGTRARASQRRRRGLSCLLCHFMLTRCEVE